MPDIVSVEPKCKRCGYKRGPWTLLMVSDQREGAQADELRLCSTCKIAFGNFLKDFSAERFRAWPYEPREPREGR